jgi:hypothetical protein
MLESLFKKLKKKETKQKDKNYTLESLVDEDLTIKQYYDILDKRYKSSLKKDKHKREKLKTIQFYLARIWYNKNKDAYESTSYEIEEQDQRLLNNKIREKHVSYLPFKG